MDFLSQVVNGLGIGSIYALVALGYSMVYGIVRLINFAHGDIIMVGAYVTYLALVVGGAPLWVAVLAPIVFCALSGVVIERLAYRPLLNQKAPRISLLITAIGVSIFLENLSQLLFSSSAKSMPNLFPGEPVSLFGLRISRVTVVTLLASVALMVLLQILIGRTRIGKAMRATSEDTEAAKMMGISTDMVVGFTFAVGSSLAAVGAVLYCGADPLINPYMGNLLGLKAFVAAVLGGIGSIPGAVFGGFLIGLAESLTKAAGGSQITDAVVFGILIVVLLFRPSGLLGKNIREKV